MGWGGRLVGACALNVPHYIGIDANTNLKTPYKHMVEFLQPQTQTKITTLFQNALDVDYSKLKYDMVFTSPPYYNIEKYQNTTAYTTRDEWDALFYRPLFYETYTYLEKGGVYCLNIPIVVYERVCIPLFGKANYKYPMQMMQRHSGNENTYKEYIYVWMK
jgi:DNA modification methylase